MSDAEAAIEENREALETLAESNLPVSGVAESLLSVVE